MLFNFTSACLVLKMKSVAYSFFTCIFKRIRYITIYEKKYEAYFNGVTHTTQNISGIFPLIFQWEFSTVLGVLAYEDLLQFCKMFKKRFLIYA